jgi:hypothetical protein
MNEHQRGKAHGATILTNRGALEGFFATAQDPTADTNARYFARGVIMGAAQTIDAGANHMTLAISTLGLDKPAPPAPLSGDELILALSRAVDTVRENAHTPVWTPLEAVLPYGWCGGFMYMGAHEARILNGSPDRRKRKTIFMYKHGITRRYLFIGDDLQAYGYMPDFCEIGDPAYSWLPMDRAVERAFEGVEEFGDKRTTKYNEAFIAERNARLVAAGITVVG